jgi:hypothetical protein
MADQQQDPKIVQQLVDLYQQVNRLTRSQAENMAKISAEAGNTTKEINRLQNELISTENSFSSIAGILKSSIQEFSKYNTTASSTKKSFSSLQSISSKLLSDQSGFSRLSEKELVKLQEKLTLETQNLGLNTDYTDLTKEQQKEVDDVLGLTAELNKLLKKRLDNEKEITKAIGVTGNALKGLSKIPGIGSMLKTEEAIEEMKELADTMQAQGKNVNSFSNKLKLASVGLKTAVGGIKAALTDPVTILTFIGESLLKGSTGIAAFEKSLGVSYEQAYKLNTQLNFVGNNVFDAYINGEKLKKSFIDLSESMGFVADYGNEALVSMTNLTGKLGLSNQEAAQLTTLSRMQSTNTEAVLDNIGRSVTAMNKQGKTTILLKDVMKEVANVSKATAVSLGSNPVKIAEAVVAAKQLGTTLQQIESTADSLLNFESSIENELKAELLTGKELNLERARAAALANDMKTLSEEIGKNEEIIGAFASGNRVAQQATAEALGMSREQLANMVYQQEAMNIGAEGVRAKYGEQAYEALKAQDAQEKFANSVEKLKSAFSSIVQIFSPLIDLLAGAAELVANITSKWYILYPLMGVIALSYIPKMAAGFANMGKSIAGMAKNFTSMFSKDGPASTITSSRGLTLTKKATDGGVDKAKEAADKAASAGGKAGAGGPKAGDGIKNTLKGISAGISSFSKVKATDILKLAGSALALVALTPAIPALLLLQLVNGKLIQGALTGLGKGLAALGNALSKPQVMLGVGVFTLAMMGLGKALGYVAPAIEAFGNVIKSVFEGIGTIITAAAGGIATIFTSLQDVDVIKLLAIGPALIGIGVGLAALGGGGILGAIGAFLSGDPIEKLQGLAASGDGLTKTATALQAIAGALAGVSVALAAMDISKLEALDEFSSNQASNAIVNGITSFITGPIKSTGNKEEINTGINLTPMIAAINEVTAAVNKLYSKDQSINMDGKKVGTTLVQNSYKAA